jgi:flavin-dependent thymidylate synthase
MEFSSELHVDYIDHMGTDESVVRAARISTGSVAWDSAPDIGPADIGLIKRLMKDKHGTPFEHNAMTFRIQAPIFVWREFMRHRIGISYNEESGRYMELAAKCYEPARGRAMIQVEGSKAMDYVMFGADDARYDQFVNQHRDSCRQAFGAYQHLLSIGIVKEVARMMLPVATYSSAYVTLNARSMMNILSLRTKRGSDEAMFPSKPQWEINNVADQMEDIFSLLFPHTHAAYVENKRVAP